MSSSGSRDHALPFSSPVDAGPLPPYSIEDAAYDSNTPESRKFCLPGTRTRYIEFIDAWSGGYKQPHRLLWVQGPAGVGKTTLARSCAREMAARGRLGASFFFSRDRNVVDTSQFFSTIAHQLAKHNDQFRVILDSKVRRDPTLPARRMDVQLEELIIRPLLELDLPVHHRVVIVDGLDDCDRSIAQSKVVELVAKSIKKYGFQIPLLWAFFSRPEPHIDRVVDTFSDDSTASLSLQISLSVSCGSVCESTCEHNTEIRAYLREILRLPRRSINSVDGSFQWPSDKDLDKLVEMSAGLFIYAVIVANFIMDSGGPLSPERRLEGVLPLEPPARSASVSTFDPLTKLDDFYCRIMERIPENLLFTVQQVLLLHYDLSYGETKASPPARLLANFVGLELGSLEHTMSKLYSVLKLRLGPVAEWGSQSISFYHTSFMEFLMDQERSKEFWIQDGRVWDALTARGLRLLDGMSKISSISDDAKVLNLQGLLSALPDSANPVPSLLEFQKEMCEQLRRNVAKWCACSELDNDDSEALRELRRTGLIERISLEIDPDLFHQIYS